MPGAHTYDGGSSKSCGYKGQGQTAGQLGSMRPGIHEEAVRAVRDQKNLGNLSEATYWSSCADIYRQCLAILLKGGHIVLILKSHVRNKKIVDLPGQTAELLQAIGFRLLHVHEVMFSTKEGQLRLDGGEDRRSWKSFFRRLTEKRGSPPINYEVVLCLEKP